MISVDYDDIDSHAEELQRHRDCFIDQMIDNFYGRLIQMYEMTDKLLSIDSWLLANIRYLIASDEVLGKIVMHGRDLFVAQAIAQGFNERLIKDINCRFGIDQDFYNIVLISAE